MGNEDATIAFIHNRCFFDIRNCVMLLVPAALTVAIHIFSVID